MTPEVSKTGSKLNQLQTLVPEGMVVDAAWLEARGYGHSLRQKYVAHHWLEPMAHGVFRRPRAKLTQEGADDEFAWRLVVVSLQNLLGYGVSVGGRSALEVQGFAHYVPASRQREVHLYANERLPGWLTKLDTSAQWVVHNRDRLFQFSGRGLTHVSVDLASGAQQRRDPAHDMSFMVAPIGPWAWPLTMSTAERAILELLDELPARESFDQVDALMSGLTTLSPRRLQGLLEHCQSVKVKRLFLLLAERHRHAWLKQLDVKRIDLGAGKRSLTPGGRYDPKYQLTVPAFLLDQRDDL